MSEKILFVDDEPSILGIYEMLGPFIGDGCAVSTAPSAEEGLRLMEKERFSVVVSDLTMPNMTGTEFLSQVARCYPSTARIVVSGFTDEVMAAKCLMVAHRYFSKPFKPTMLGQSIAALCDAQNFAANSRIREFVCKIEALPTLSKTYLALTKALKSSEVPVREVSRIIEKDPGLTAKVLQMVNSVAIAPARRITTIFDAIQLIGFGVVHAMVLGVQVFEFCSEVSRTDLYRHIWKHSLQTAFCAKRLSSLEGLPPEACDETFFLGLLHDIGKVVLSASSPDYYPLWSEHRSDSSVLLEKEVAMFGADHAHVGAYLLRLWGLPAATTQSVLMHHSLNSLETDDFNPVLAVHAAQELVPDRQNGRLNQGLIDQIGLADHIPSWRAAVRNELARIAE